MIHHIYKASWRSTLAILVWLASGFIASWLILTNVSLPLVPHYLNLHAILETLSISVSALIFGLCWNAYGLLPQMRVLILAAGFLAVSLLDLAHTMSFAGMPDYFTPNSSAKGINFWLAARYIAAFTLLTVSLCPERQNSAGNTTREIWKRFGALFVAFLAAALIHLWLMVYPQTFPATFVPDLGVTPFKTQAEYGIIALHLITVALLYRQMRTPCSFNLPMLLGAVGTMAMSETFFTSYSATTDYFNLLGHVYKVAAYWMLYKAVFVDMITAPHHALSASREHLQAIQDTIPDLICEMNLQGFYLDVRGTPQVFLGQPTAQLLGKNVYQVMPAEAAQTMLSILQEAREKRTLTGRIIRLPHAGKTLWFELSVKMKGMGSGRNPEFIVLTRDVTQRMQDQESLHKLNLAVQQSPSSIVITDLEARIEYVNQAFARITGYSEEEVKGRNPRILSAGKTPPSTYQEMWRQLTQGHSWRGEFVNRRKDGTEFTESVWISPVVDDHGQMINYLAIKEDITERKRATERIEQLAHSDALTGLPNRLMFNLRFQQALSLTERAQGNLALLYLDLDNFKHINESLGHQVGDALLVEMARRLKELLRAEDTISRPGGDEFFVALPLTDATGAAQAAARLQDAVQKSFRIEPYELVVTSSIGIAMYPRDGQSFEALSQCAEIAMNQAKEAGRDAHRFYSPDMQSRSSRVLQLETGLRFALSLGQFEVHYQPQIRIEDRKLIGVEALLRWNHPELGRISPAEFIPIAEKTGQILGIGAWVLHTAMTQTQRWLDAGYSDLVVAVNLSLIQFRHEGLVPLVQNLLAKSGLPPSHLELELTESIAMQEPDHVIAVVNQLHELGVKLSIDDFGTGYSSLSYLKRLQVHKLKIDLSFVRDINRDSGDQSIVDAIIRMASGLGLTTIAEGVETQAQLDTLQRLGCNEVQGYLFSKPLPAQEIEALIASGFQNNPQH